MRPAVFSGRILDAKCKCGKLCLSFIAWDQHLQMKHPKWRRQLRKSGELTTMKVAFERAVGWGEMI